MRRALAAFPVRTALACAAALLSLDASGAAHAVPWYFQAPASRMVGGLLFLLFIRRGIRDLLQAGQVGVAGMYHEYAH